MTLGEVVVEYRKAHSISQRSFAKMCGMSNAYISMLENNRNAKTGLPIVPSLTAIKNVARAMDVPLNDVLEMMGDVPVSLSSEDEQPQPLPSNIVPVKRVRIPMLGGIAAGEPILAEQQYDAYVEADADLDCTYALRVDGDSMEPTVRYGDIVFIRQQEDVDDGRIAAVLVDDSATLKRVYHIPNGLQLLSDNAAKYPPRAVTFEDYDCIRILGLAVAFKRNL